MEVDRISNLSNDVTDKILSRLPLGEAMRTSVLSSRWKYKSAMLPDLVFDYKFLSDNASFVKIVDHVLLVHIGPIRKFKLSKPDVILAACDIDRWIIHLSRNSIKELVLDIWKGGPYNIPSCLFSCQDIVHLELYLCNLPTFPSTFKGFKCLKNLDVQSVTLAQDLLGKLIGCSPLLERLTLRDCDGFTNIRVNAPNLKIIDVNCVYEEVNLENTLHLADVSIDLSIDVDPKCVPSSASSNLLKFFDNDVPHIQRLTIGSYFLKYLAVGTLPEKLPKACVKLNFISVHISFNNLNEILTILCLLRSSPVLQELDIPANQKNQAAMGEVNSLLDDNQSFTFSQLRVVNISNISGLKAELDFIRFLLSSTPVLGRMTIKPTSVDCSSALLKELLRFRRDSKLAEIIYLEP